MSTHFNKLSPAEAERLALLMEECSEVQQVIGKILRHGYASHHPKDRKARPTTNRQYLEKELGDVMAAMGLCLKAGDVNSEKVDGFCNGKLANVKQYLHHN